MRCASADTLDMTWIRARQFAHAAILCMQHSVHASVGAFGACQCRSIRCSGTTSLDIVAFWNWLEGHLHRGTEGEGMQGTVPWDLKSLDVLRWGDEVARVNLQAGATIGLSVAAQAPK